MQIMWIPEPNSHAESVCMKEVVSRAQRGRIAALSYYGVRAYIRDGLPRNQEPPPVEHIKDYIRSSVALRRAEELGLLHAAPPVQQEVRSRRSSRVGVTHGNKPGAQNIHVEHLTVIFNDIVIGSSPHRGENVIDLTQEKKN